MSQETRETKALAAEIARDLFTDVAGNRAARLVMEHDCAPLVGSGWSERAVADRIEAALTKAKGTPHGE